MNVEENLRYEDILLGAQPPEPESYAEGRAARDADKAFHEGPRPTHSVKALSWRLGWNDRALELEV